MVTIRSVAHKSGLIEQDVDVVCLGMCLEVGVNRCTIYLNITELTCLIHLVVYYL